MPNCGVHDSEIMDWASGNLENCSNEQLMVDNDIIDNIHNNTEELQKERSCNINNVISSFNDVIEWATNRPRISFSDILILRKLSNIAAIDKYPNDNLK